MNSMGRFWAGVLAATALAAWAPPRAAAEEMSQPSSLIHVGARPSWVDYQETPESRDEDLRQAQDGVLYLLLDSQTVIENNSYQHYWRTVRRVLDRAGLEDSGRLEFVFDPTEDEFYIHSINVIRGNEVINRLDANAFSIIQREADLGEGVTDGDLTAYFQIPDVRVGDTIDYEISWKSASKIWPGQYFSDFSIEWSVPVGLFHRKIVTPKDKPLTILPRGQTAPPQIEAAASSITYDWRREHQKLVRGEDAVPSTFPIWASVAVSTLPTWRKVAGSLAPQYEAGAVAPERILESLAPAGAPLNVRVTSAIRYVQDEIRYVADETGVGSHLPRSPELVVARGWGDCKDKALLLVSILREMGLEAHVALTDNDAGNALPQLAPSPLAFDHAIVVAIIEGKRHWIDATFSHQGGVFPNIAPPVVGYALPLMSGADQLWPVEVTSSPTPDRKVTETFDFAKSAEAGVTLEVKTAYLGAGADGFRRTLASQSSGGLSANYLKYYEGLYPGIEQTGDIAVTDDRDKNAIVTVERYVLTAERYLAADIKSAFLLQADAVRNQLTEINKTSRRAPISLPFPLHVEHVVQLKNTGVKMSGIDDYSANTPEFEFVRRSIPEGKSVWISWRLMTKAPEIPLVRMPDYSKLVDELDDWNVVEYNLDEGAASELTPLGIASAFAFGFTILSGFFVLFTGWQSLKTDAATISPSIFHPVSTGKFIILGAATLGLYVYIWMYRCWRQAKRSEERAISPAFRAIFGAFFYFPLFDEIRRKMPPGTGPSVAIGAALAGAYLILSVAANAAARGMKEMGWEAIAVSLSDAVIFLLVVPLVIWTNRLNSDRPDVIAANSRWKVRSYALLVFGLSFWPLIVLGGLSPE